MNMVYTTFVGPTRSFGLDATVTIRATTSAICGFVGLTTSYNNQGVLCVFICTGQFYTFKVFGVTNGIVATTQDVGVGLLLWVVAINFICGTI